MDWASFIPSVITGGLCGVFIARAYAWKRRYMEMREDWMREATLSSMTRDHLQQAEDALKQAHMQQAAQKHSAQMLASAQMGQIQASDITDDMLEKILRDVNAQPKTFVIQEEI